MSTVRSTKFAANVLVLLSFCKWAHLKLSHLTGIFIFNVFPTIKFERMTEIIELVEVWYGFLQFVIKYLQQVQHRSSAETLLLAARYT